MPIKFMGVVNITPDSFSDGGVNFSSAAILKSTKKLLNDGADFIDFGAESTAPFNSKISAQEELTRFKEFLLPALPELLKLTSRISFDTYKPEVFVELAEEVFKIDKNCQLTWNDISGHVDSKTHEVLKAYPNTSYVLSHNLAPTRAQANEHMDFVNDDLSTADVVNFFKEKLALFDHEQILLDPCFGFSKTAKQNWMLIKELPSISANFSNGWLLGISKKSFLQKKSIGVDGASKLSYSESMHILAIYHWLREMPQVAKTIRLHDVALGKNAVSFQQNLT